MDIERINFRSSQLKGGLILDGLLLRGTSITTEYDGNRSYNLGYRSVCFPAI